MRSNQLARETTTVIVVKKPIGRGYQIQEDSVEVKQVPVDFAHKSMPNSLDQVVGRVATVMMDEGEYVMSNKLTSTGAKAGLATLIPAGFRAYSITSGTAANRVSGLINVGDHVDVLLTRGSTSTSSNSSVAETLLQNVEVLAVDRVVENVAGKNSGAASSKNDSKASTVTLLVTPKQAAVLGLGQKEGVLSLSLRNPEDQIITDSTELSGAELTDYTDAEALEKISLDGKRQEKEPAEESMSVEEMQALLAFFAESNQPAPKFTAIRTIRGSRLGVVPVRTKSK
jgi:pilus assembly protein CpaB